MAVKDNTSKELAPKAGTEVAEVIDYSIFEMDRGAGFENQTAEDISIPYFEVLQSNSPECELEDGPRPGQLINRTSGDIFPGKEGITFIPAVTQHVVVEWVPREKGGGLVATYELGDPLITGVRESQPLGKYTHPTNGNDLIETFYVYGVYVDPSGNGHPGVISFSSTRIKPYKDWMYKARSIVINLPDGRKITKLPLFSHSYRITTVAAENNKGKWHTVTANFEGGNATAARINPNSDLYSMAKQLCEDVNEGRKKADTENAGTRSEFVDRAPKQGDTDADDAPV